MPNINNDSLETEIKECVRCGFCCSKGPCVYGKSGGLRGCKYLKRDSYTMCTYVCSKQKQIQEIEKDATYPMFGGKDNGCCCSAFNTRREFVIKRITNMAAQRMLR